MKCPACFRVLPPVPHKLVCVGSCNPAADPGASKLRGHEVRTGPRFDPHAGAEATPCPTCRVPSSQEVCPACAYPILPNWRGAKTTFIAMAGARATGKSMLLAVAKEQLELIVERHHHSHLKGVGDTDALFESNYVKPLYDQGQILQATAGVDARDALSRQPMTFQFQERLPDGQKRLRILVLRDVAGEDLEAMGQRDESLTFFSRADAVIALLDPLAVPQVKEMLTDLIPPATRVGGDGVAVLSHVLSLMNGHVPGARTTIPVAIVLSKVDVLQKLREVRGTVWSRIMNRPGSPLQRDPSLMSAEFDPVEGDLMHEEVTGLLGLLQAEMLVAQVREAATNYRFFAVSALGESPEGETLHQGGVAPFRATDPFKWAMQVNG